MGFFSGLKRIFRNAIECPDKYANNLFYIASIKKNKIKVGATLFVRENFIAVLSVKNKVTDVFVSGKHKLILGAMPLTTRRVNFKRKKKDKKPKEFFKGEIYFFNLGLFKGEFTTIEPVVLKDETLGRIKVRANGSFTFRIENAKTFLEACFLEWAYVKEEPVKKKINFWVGIETVKQLNYLNPPLLEFAKNNEYLSERIFEQVFKKLISLGLEVTEFKIEETFIPGKYANELQQMNTDSQLINDMERDIAYIREEQRIEREVETERYLNEEYYAPTGYEEVEENNLQMQKSTNDHILIEEAPRGYKEETKICNYCGTLIDKDAIACYNCGRKQTNKRICPNCNAEVDEGEFVCPNCRGILI